MYINLWGISVTDGSMYVNLGGTSITDGGMDVI